MGLRFRHRDVVSWSLGIDSLGPSSGAARANSCRTTLHQLAMVGDDA